MEFAAVFRPHAQISGAVEDRPSSNDFYGGRRRRRRDPAGHHVYWRGAPPALGLVVRLPFRSQWSCGPRRTSWAASLPGAAHARAPHPRRRLDPALKQIAAAGLDLATTKAPPCDHRPDLPCRRCGPGLAIRSSRCRITPSSTCPPTPQHPGCRLRTQPAGRTQLDLSDLEEAARVARAKLDALPPRTRTSASWSPGRRGLRPGDLQDDEELLRRLIDSVDLEDDGVSPRGGGGRHNRRCV